MEINYFNMCMNNLKKKINKNTLAIIGVHCYGLTADISSLITISKEEKIFLIEDACLNFGGKKNGTYYSKNAIKKVVELNSNKKIKIIDLWNIIRGTNCKDIYKNTDHGFYIKFKNKKFKITSKIQKITTH